MDCCGNKERVITVAWVPGKKARGHHGITGIKLSNQIPGILFPVLVQVTRKDTNKRILERELA